VALFVLNVIVEEFLAENDLYRRAGRVMQITATKVATACVFDGRTDQVPPGLEAVSGSPAALPVSRGLPRRIVYRARRISPRRSVVQLIGSTWLKDRFSGSARFADRRVTRERDAISPRGPILFPVKHIIEVAGTVRDSVTPKTRSV
jgi:hypothetical protein